VGRVYWRMRDPDKKNHSNRLCFGIDLRRHRKMEAPLVSENAGEVAYPNLELAQMMYEFENGAANLQDKILETVLADNMAATYTSLCKKYEWTFDSAAEAKMSEENEEAVEKLLAAEADAAGTSPHPLIRTLIHSPPSHSLTHSPPP